VLPVVVALLLATLLVPLAHRLRDRGMHPRAASLLVVAAGIAVLLRARAVKRERIAWLLLGAAILCWAAGEVYWTQAILDSPEPPYPSPADAFYLAFYPLAYAGLALLVRARAQELDWRRWSDGVIAALGTAALGVAFVFDFVADRTTGTALEVATSLAYPLGDIVMLALVVGIVALTDWRPGEDLVAAARRPRRPGGRRHRLHPAGHRRCYSAR